MRRCRENARGGRIFSEDLLRKVANNRSGECLIAKAGLPDREAYILLCAACHMESIEPPKVEKHPVTGMLCYGPAVKRMCCKRWWLRRLRTYHSRGFEATARDLCVVSRKAQVYASDETVARVEARAEENVSMLELMEAVCEETGEAVSLAEIATHSLANPALRRGEIMMRTRGFDEYAQSLGYSAVMVTTTCPSRFHPVLSKTGAANPRYEGATPRDSQAHLCGNWARARAKIKRREIDVFGLRVAEPHHDGTPHHHYLLFAPADRMDEVKAILTEYALRDSPEEPGAQVRRITFVDIDRSNGGSAAGYVAKYISKSLDGFGLQEDLLGLDITESVKRVVAWARTWGIRQFQQFGGPRVGLWREARRVREEVAGAPEGFELIRKCADSGDWAGFCKYSKNLDFYKEHSDRENAYGEMMNESVKGLLFKGWVVVTRPLSWLVKVTKTAMEKPSMMILGADYESRGCLI